MTGKPAIDVVRDHERYMWGNAHTHEKKESARRFDEALSRLGQLVDAAAEMFARNDDETFSEEEVQEAHDLLRAALRAVAGDTGNPEATG